MAASVKIACFQNIRNALCEKFTLIWFVDIFFHSLYRFSIERFVHFFMAIFYRGKCVMLSRGWLKKMFFYSVFNTHDYAFLCLYTQSRHFENSKMVNWVSLVQKMTKIQGIM